MAQTISMSGGTLDVQMSRSRSLGGALTQAGSITIDVKAEDKTLTLFRSSGLSLGANTLTLERRRNTCKRRPGS